MHVGALLALFASEEPLAVLIQPTDAGKIQYTIGDASAEGCGMATQYPDMTVEARDGLWDEEFAKGGSNLHDAQNIGNHLLADIKSGRHDGCE
jgi:hypothetical protein